MNLYRIWSRIDGIDSWLETHYLADDERAAAMLVEMIHTAHPGTWAELEVRPE